MPVQKSFINIAKTIGKAREDARLSQHALALKLGFKNGQAVSNIERGKCSIPREKIFLASMVLKIPSSLIIEAMVLDERDHMNMSVTEAKEKFLASAL